MSLNVVLTGHTQGIGQSVKQLFEKHNINVTGLSRSNGYDLNKIKTITSLIFLNMAPLHEKEFGDLLFFKSKEMLQGLND